LVSERKKHVLTVSEKPVVFVPGLQAEATELPSVIVLNYQNRGVPLFAFVEEGNQTAAVHVEIEHSGPFALSVKRWELSNQVADHDVA
jgi:hypothetical protein